MRASPAPRWAAAALLALATACAHDPPPSVLLVVVDTLRHDALGVYGARRNTSPALDAFAETAVRFERAYAAAPWTKPSVASILTGLYPSGHGAIGTGRALAEEVPTLAAILRRHGYRTAAVVTQAWVTPQTGLARGFETFLGDWPHPAQISTDEISENALALLDELAAGAAPFFLYVHYFDPHYDYMRHPEIGFVRGRTQHLDGTEKLRELLALRPKLTPQDLALLRAVYHEEVRHTDAGIGRLLEGLDALDDEVLVVITADHGEEFMERGWIGHTRSLYDELMRVPLLVRAPGEGPRSVEHPVSLVSIAPTVLELAGIDPDPFGFQAPSLAATVRGEAEPPDEPVLAEVAYVPVFMPEKRAHKSAIVAGSFKLIRDERTRALELYNVSRDPDERLDLVLRRPGLAARLEAQLDERLAQASRRAPPAAPLELGPQQTEALRRLGYAE